MEKELSFFAMSFHVHKIKNLAVPVIFVAAVKSSLQAMIALLWFHGCSEGNGLGVCFSCLLA
jgi:hypothetical protein